MKVGRNDPCPCGSGRKYKRCCALKAGELTDSRGKSLPWRFGLLVALGVGGAVALLMPWGRDDGSALVWSAEHGHWHDPATGMEPVTGSVPPPEPAPPGKVWSAEHGHWHDIK